MVSRSFRRLRLAVAVLATLISAAHAEVHFGGVAAGDISSTDAILWTRAENEGSAADLTAQVATDPGFSNIVGTLGGRTGADRDFTLKLDATGLTSNSQYYYRFLAPGSVTSATGQFTTAPTAAQRVAVKFGFSGDSDGRVRPYPLIAKIASQKLNYFIFLGHTMYETASAGSPEVPVISGLTTNAADLSSALTVYNEKYRNNVCGVNPDRSAEHLRPAESAVDAGCDRNLYSARQPRARQ